MESFDSNNVGLNSQLYKNRNSIPGILFHVVELQTLTGTGKITSRSGFVNCALVINFGKRFLSRAHSFFHYLLMNGVLNFLNQMMIKQIWHILK